MKKILFFLLVLFTLTAVSAEPVEAGFFDWIWSFFTYEDEGETKKSNQKINDEISLSIYNETYQENEIKDYINSQDEYTQLISDVDYECFQVEIGEKENFSIQFDLNQSKIKDMSKDKSCDSKILVEPQLIENIKEDGFNQSKLDQYSEQVDLPVGVYITLAQKYLN